VQRRRDLPHADERRVALHEVQGRADGDLRLRIGDAATELVDGLREPRELIERGRAEQRPHPAVVIGHGAPRRDPDLPR
jgi:hypothetical protein